MNMKMSSLVSSSDSKKAVEQRRHSDVNKGQSKRKSSFRVVPMSSTALLDTSDHNSVHVNVGTSMIVMDNYPNHRRATAQGGGGAEGGNHSENDNQPQHQLLTASLVAAHSLSYYLILNIFFIHWSM